MTARVNTISARTATPESLTGLDFGDDEILRYQRPELPPLSDVARYYALSEDARGRRRSSIQIYAVGSTRSVSSVADTRPPITTVASGRCTSAPALVETAIGMKPTLATSAVISTGRSRVVAPR